MTFRYFNPSLQQRVLLAMLATLLLHMGSLYDWVVLALSNAPEPEPFESFDDWASFVLSNIDFSITLYDLYIRGPLLALLLLAPMAVADRRWLRFGGLIVAGTVLMPALFWVDMQSPVDLDTMQSWLIVPIFPIICALGAGAAVRLVCGQKTNRLFWPVVAGAGVLGGLALEYGDNACQSLLLLLLDRCSPWPPLFGTMTYLCLLSIAFYVGSDAERNHGSNKFSGVIQKYSDV